MCDLEFFVDVINCYFWEHVKKCLMQLVAFLSKIYFHQEKVVELAPSLLENSES